MINLERRSDWPFHRVGLDPIRALLDRLGNPERALPVIHIAGSKGKGSTALLLEGLLDAAGYRVGVFHSPHLSSFAERFRVAGREVEGGRLAAVVQELAPHIEALRAERPEDAPTFFDALCAAGLQLFSEDEVDWCVLEVGLGGRLDSTNAVTPRCCVITSIELEHTEVLGETLAEIAGEKAGILKSGVPLVLGPVPDEAAEVILSRAASLGVPVVRAGVDYEVAVEGVDPSGVRARYRSEGNAFEFTLPLPGVHHAINAALAIATLQRVSALPVSALVKIADAAFPETVLPGRAECLGREPTLIVDAAHTAASARALAATLMAMGVEEKSVHFVLSISAGKDLEPILAAWLPFASRFTLTRALAARSLDPEVLADAIRAGQADAMRAGPAGSAAPLRIVADPERAIREARASLDPGETLCATGSFFLAGIARRLLASPAL